MKCLTITAHTDDQQDLTNLLNGIEQVQGFSIIQVEGHGIESEKDAFLSAREKVVGSSPRVQLDIILQDNDVSTVLDALRGAAKEGNVYYRLTAVEKSGHL